MTTYNLKDNTGATWIRCTILESAGWIKLLTKNHPTLTFTLQVQ